jgi:lysyl-tRNA synthetase class 2
MPPTAGIAVGLDRLLMLQRNAANIADVLPFPLHQTPPFSEQIEPN